MVLPISELSTEKKVWKYLYLGIKKNKYIFPQQTQWKILSTEMWHAGQKYGTERSLEQMLDDLQKKVVVPMQELKYSFL